MFLSNNRRIINVCVYDDDDNDDAKTIFSKDASAVTDSHPSASCYYRAVEVRLIYINISSL